MGRTTSIGSLCIAVAAAALTTFCGDSDEGAPPAASTSDSGADATVDSSHADSAGGSDGTAFTDGTSSDL
jgi:hypothetical protein